MASACALLCESKNTTEPPRSAHLDLVLECVELHINTQSAGFRYDLLSALKRVSLIFSHLLVTLLLFIAFQPNQ